MYKIRTIDVWDTLLRRDCHPECIKLATAYHLLFGWRDQIKPEFRDGWLLYKARLEAERALALKANVGGKDDEYEITRVFVHWAADIFTDTTPPNLPVLLAEFELSVEITRSYADPKISDFLVLHQAEKTLFLSDFYMSADMLNRLLASKGLDVLVSSGLSSCDVGLNKRSGLIFQHVHTIHAVSPKDHVHIGDNEWSDVASPRALGVKALHYLPESEHTERLARERLFSSREVLFNHIIAECANLAQEATKGLTAKHNAALSLGIQAAPLFIGFALWIAEQAILNKLDRLYFFTREGEFFYRIYCSLFPQHRLFGHYLPPVDVLEVSRLSTFAPSMKDASIEEMTRIWSLFKVQSISGLFVTLGLDIENFSELLEKLDLKKNDVVIDPENSLELRRLFATSTFIEAARHSLTSQTKILQNYLKQCGLYGNNRVGIVDIGWRGTIQDNISLLVPDVYFHGMYLGLLRFINAQAGNVCKAAYVADENISSKSSSLFSNFAVMELLCNSSRGSVVGYSIQNGSTKALRYIDHEENAIFDEFVMPFQEGVMLALQVWRPYLERYVVSSNELHSVALHVWDKLRRSPDDGLVQVYLRTPQQDIFGYGEIFKRNQYPSLNSILLSPFLNSRRRLLLEFIRRVQWSEAIEKSNDLGLFHRQVLLVIFRLANLIKRSRYKSWLLKILHKH